MFLTISPIELRNSITETTHKVSGLQGEVNNGLAPTGALIAVVALMVPARLRVVLRS
jgi:hypothetical protein